MKKYATLVSVAIGASAIFCTMPLYAKVTSDTPLQKQRLEILQIGNKGASALPVLAKALQSESPLIRRAAVLSLGQVGKLAQSLLRKTLQTDKDALTRRTALRILMRITDKANVPVIGLALNDESEIVRAAAVEGLAGLHPRTSEVTTLLEKAQDDASPRVSKIASDALRSFHEAGVSFRELPGNKDLSWDVVQTIPLPEDDWRFHTDVGKVGEINNWFKPDFDDSDWQSVSIGKTWESELGKDYDGIGWYRRTFTLPQKPAQQGTDIVFEGVDESTWVWINGNFIGSHDIGTVGWDKQFAMDVTKELKWGAKNQITVRVMDTAYAGGIWKPVYLEVLDR